MKGQHSYMFLLAKPLFCTTMNYSILKE